MTRVIAGYEHGWGAARLMFSFEHHPIATEADLMAKLERLCPFELAEDSEENQATNSRERRVLYAR